MDLWETIFSNRYYFINIKWLTILSDSSGRYVPCNKWFTKRWRYSTASGGAPSVATKKVKAMIIIILSIAILHLASCFFQLLTNYVVGAACQILIQHLFIILCYLKLGLLHIFMKTELVQCFPQVLRTWGDSSKFDGGGGLSQYMGEHSGA